MIDSYQNLLDVLQDCESAIEDMRESGYKFAVAKRDYGVALAKKILELRVDGGFPVTLVPDLARGDEEVAHLRYLRDAAHSEWEADRHNAERLKSTSWILQRQIEMEMRGR